MRAAFAALALAALAACATTPAAKPVAIATPVGDGAPTDSAMDGFAVSVWHLEGYKHLKGDLYRRDVHYCADTDTAAGWVTGWSKNVAGEWTSGTERVTPRPRPGPRGCGPTVPAALRALAADYERREGRHK